MLLALWASLALAQEPVEAPEPVDDAPTEAPEPVDDEPEPEPEPAPEPSCPDPGVALQRAENDALNYYLADAQAGLQAAVDAWGCSAPVESGPLGRYLAIRGLLAHFDNDDDRARRAFAASRAQGTAFPSDYGEVVQALWDAAEAPEGDPAPLQLKGVNDDDRVWLDGQPSEGLVPQGLHLFQVGDGDTARFARLLDVTSDQPLVVAVPVVPRPGPVPAPAPAADPAPAPAPTPVDGIVFGPRVIPASAAGIVPPIAHEGGRLYLDAEGDRLRWRRDVFPLGRYDVDGRIARRRYRSARTGQIVSVVATPILLYTSYLFAWDATTGHNLPTGRSVGTTLVLGGAGVGTGLWGYSLFKKRPKHREAVVESAQRVITGNAL